MDPKDIGFACHIKSYGVSLRIESNVAEIGEKAVATARSALLENVAEATRSEGQQVLSLIRSTDGTCKVLQNGNNITEGEPGRNFWRFFDSLVRVTVADHAPEHVFIHAGVVAWHGRALLLPGKSHTGKSTLVAELVRAGAVYYSDEYAVLDADGFVHPFARPLAMRVGPDGLAIPVHVDSLGGIAGSDPIRVGCVFFTHFDPEMVVNYDFMTLGQGVVEVIGQTISIKRNPDFVIKVLKNAFSGAIIVKSPRPDAGEFARQLLEFIDKTIV